MLCGIISLVAYVVILQALTSMLMIFLSLFVAVVICLFFKIYFLRFHMTISKKILIAISIFLGIIAIMGSASLYQLFSVSKIASMISDQELPSVRYSSAMRAEVIDFRNRETQLLITVSSSEIDETLGRQQKNFDALKKFEDLYKSSISRDEQKTLLVKYQTAFDTYIKTHDKLVEIVRSGDQKKSIEYFRTEQRVAFRNLLPAIDKIVEDSISSSNNLREQALQIKNSAIAVLIGIFVVSICVGVLVALMLKKSVIVPLELVRTSIAKVVKSKDFTTPIGIKGEDELSQTSMAVDELTKTVRNTLRDFISAIDEISRTGSSLAMSAQQVSKSSSEQTSVTVLMSTSIDKLTSSIAQVDENAQTLSNVACDSNLAAENGHTVMGRTISQFRDIGDKVRDTAERISQLSEASNEITSIIEVIREVADQTNLLALNAAIEASRAGDYGKGFAVVAEEIRMLAERTELATKDIADKIVAIQKSAESAKNQMETSVVKVKTGMEDTDTALSSIEKITENVALVNSEVSEISTSIHEYGATSREISKKIEQVARLSEENSKNAQENVVLASELASLSGRLKKSAEIYRV